MSGGEYDYAFSHVEDMAERMRKRHQTDTAILAFAAHLERVALAMRAVESADSGGTSWNYYLYAHLRSFNGGNAESLKAVTNATKPRDALNDIPLPPRTK